MTEIQKAQDLLARIASYAERKDHESAHAVRDELWMGALQAIAEECKDDPVELAQMALRTEEIRFNRYCS